MVTESMIVHAGQEPTEEQRTRIREAAKMPITFDDDCPEISDEQFKRFAVMAEQQRASRRKEVLSLRVSPETIEKAKKLGKGYTGILGRLLDMAINNPQMVKKCL